MRIAPSLFFFVSFFAIEACGSDPPAPQIPLARLGSDRCTPYDAQPIDRACLPRVAAENAPLAIEAEERCGSCSSTVEMCTVTVAGRDVTLSLDGRSCQLAPGESCPAACTKHRATCRVPALPAGRYTIRYADADGRVDTLEIAAGGATACTLDAGT